VVETSTRNLIILLTDIEDFTPKSGRKTRADIRRMLEEHKQLVLPVLEGKGGRLVKSIGDAFLVVFDSPTDAVLAGIEVQRILCNHNAGKDADDRLDVRIAVNAGEVTLADGDVFGEPVNITARINGIAQAGEVFFTEAVYLAMNKREVPSSEVGLMQLKGIVEKIRVYKVVREKPIGETSAGASIGAVASAGSGSSADELVVPRSKRVGAFVLDIAICAFFLSALFSASPFADVWAAIEPDSFSPRMASLAEAAGIANGDGVPPSSRKLVSCSLFWLLYSTFFLSVWGATPGKKALGIRIVQTDGSRLDWRVSLIRSLFSVISGNLGLLGYIWGFVSKSRLTWHDRIAGTRAISGPALAGP
jgi:class 3 adenylate cyclase/uncharacterized RDD family membrane protein YckC